MADFTHRDWCTHLNFPQAAFATASVTPQFSLKPLSATASVTPQFLYTTVLPNKQVQTGTDRYIRVLNTCTCIHYMYMYSLHVHVCMHVPVLYLHRQPVQHRSTGMEPEHYQYILILFSNITFCTGTCSCTVHDTVLPFLTHTVRT